MPFDGVLTGEKLGHAGVINNRLAIRRSRSLHEILASQGIEPVSLSILDQHKAAEIIKHPPSFFWHRRMLHALLTVGSVTAAWGFGVQAMVNLSPYPIILLSFFSVCFFALTFGLMSMTAKGPAMWREDAYVLDTLPAMPAPLTQLATRLAEDDPRVRFVVGTLYQKDVVLDPYLMAIKYTNLGQSVVCLGIWDNDKIIHLAG